MADDTHKLLLFDNSSTGFVTTSFLRKFNYSVDLIEYIPNTITKSYLDTLVSKYSLFLIDPVRFSRENERMKLIAIKLQERRPVVLFSSVSKDVVLDNLGYNSHFIGDQYISKNNPGRLIDSLESIFQSS